MADSMVGKIINKRVDTSRVLKNYLFFSTSPVQTKWKIIKIMLCIYISILKSR